MSRHFKINGIPYLVLSKFTVLKLITYLGFNQNLIVIDYNGNLLEKNLWTLTYVKNGDSLEILSIAGGG
jgi:thiamine biosynthesis protein ThiS|tara:strand:- start:1131 stop:1337 length:207 start_codon:yes stop_codon:yes gene_type:complete